MSGIDRAGRQIAGLLGYNPGPGIYSRLERAVQGMPSKVRVQELPGLLKRYKEGVPGWELKATDLDSVIAGRDVVPQEELLAAVRERSPVYTHREIVLGGNPPQHYSDLYDNMYTRASREPSALGRGVFHGEPRFANYGQGGTNPTEILLIDSRPVMRQFANLSDYPHHYDRYYPGPQMPKKFDAPQEIIDAATAGTVSHMRYDRHGDALRLNEVQSDLQNYNIKANKRGGEVIPFALQDAQKDIQLKRFLLQAARDGSAVEIAAPADIADVVGMPLEHAQHLYGKVYPSDLRRFARPFGGLIDEPIPPAAVSGDTTTTARDALGDIHREAELAVPARADDAYRRLVTHIRMTNRGEINDPNAITFYANQLANVIGAAGRPVAQEMPTLMHMAGRHADAINALNNANVTYGTMQKRAPPPGFRARLSDEARRRIVDGGIGASVLAPLMMQGEE